jgi:hypothetical protein
MHEARLDLLAHYFHGVNGFFGADERQNCGISHTKFKKIRHITQSYFCHTK